MRPHRSWRWWLGIAVFVSLGARFLGETPVSSAARSSGALGAVTEYMEALGKRDLGTIQRTLAADYDYDLCNCSTGRPAFDARDPFQSPLGLTYEDLRYRIETWTAIGRTATVVVWVMYRGIPNNPRAQKAPVLGHGTFVLEAQVRDSEWKITAVRPVRLTYRKEDLEVSDEIAQLFLLSGLLPGFVVLNEFTANGQTALTVKPGVPLSLSATTQLPTNAVLRVAGVIGRFPDILRSTQPMIDPETKKYKPWTAPLVSPLQRGRYLVHAVANIAPPGIDFLGAEQVTIPVTVVGTR